MKKGQVSIEFITIFGFVFLMTIPLIIIFFDQSGNVQDSIAENQLRNIAIKIADKAEMVYYSGEPSKSTIKVYFPERVNEITITSRTVSFNYTTSNNINHNIYAVSLVNITGTLSPSPGIHYIEIEASNGEVTIGEI